MCVGGEAQLGRARTQLATNRLFFDRRRWCRNLLGCHGIANVFASDLVMFFAEMSSGEIAACRIRLVATECTCESSVCMSSKIVCLENRKTGTNIVAFRAMTRSTNRAFVNSLDVCQQVAVSSVGATTLEAGSCSPTHMKRTNVLLKMMIETESLAAKRAAESFLSIVNSANVCVEISTLTEPFVTR